MTETLTAPPRDGRSAPQGIEAGLLDLKGRRAKSHPHLLPRERLVRQLLEARDVPVALLVAPAGYGKTSLLSEWEARDDRPFAWVTLDAADNDPTTLLSAIALALDEIEPIGWEAFEALSSNRPNAAVVALQRLAVALRSRRVPLVLALDDVHVLEAEAARRSVIALAHLLPVGSQLALASRSESALPVARLRAQGGAVELRAEQLAMTRSEASSLLSLAGIELAAERVHTLVRRTEGWPAGLYLAALSLQEQQEDAPGVDGFAGDDRFVSDYVREEFLSGLPAGDLAFLMRTSVLGPLSAALCDAALQTEGSADVLARLARGNVLLGEVDRSDTPYRYHELFAQVLRSELHRKEPGRRGELHVRASEWCEGHSEPERAIDHAIEAHDAHRAGRLLWGSMLRQAGFASDAKIRGRLARFTHEEMSATPMLALAAAASRFAAGDLYEAERLTSLAGAASTDDDEARAGVAIMQAGFAKRGVTRMGSDAATARGLFQDGSPWHPLCLLLEGVALHLTGDREGAVAQLQEGAHRAAVSAPMFQALCLAQLALVAVEDGDLDRAAVLVGRAEAQVRRCHLHDCPTMALVLGVSAAVQAERGRSEQAGKELRQALELLSGITDPSPWYEVECRLVLARAALALHALTAARELLATAARVLRQVPDAGVLHEWLDRAQAEVDIALDCTAVTDWSLTAAELRVLGYLPSHLSLREIAGRLYVSPNTVKTHARGIYRKLGVSSRGHAVDRARSAGLMPLAAGEAPT